MAGLDTAWLLIVAMGIAAACAMRAFGLTFDWSSAALPGFTSMALLAGVGVYRILRPDTCIATALESTAQLILFSAAAATLSYAVAALDAPFWDDRFAAWDRALGLNWRAYIAFVEGDGWLTTAFDIAYNSLMAQLIVAPLVLGFSGSLSACRGFVRAVIVAGFVTVVISAFMPASSVFIHLGLLAREHSTLDLAAAFDPSGPLNGLRAGTLKVVSLTGAEGIIAFPSFHAALGVLFVAAFWRLRWTRWPALALNATMIAATPVNGGHYFVDVLAGIVVAVASLLAARFLDRPARLSAPDNETALPAQLATEAQAR